ncbi:hypothetical protein QAD02_000862, partial [Eretmocerus hayati]
QAIVDGSRASANEYSFSAVLKRDGQFICGGSIIDEMHVVTAASCIIQRTDTELEKNIRPLQVVVGSNNYNDPAAKTIDVIKVQIPNVYLSTKRVSGIILGDIAVLTLNEKLDLRVTNPTLSKLFLPEDDMTYESLDCTFVGSGWDSVTDRVDLDTNEIVRDGQSSGTRRVVQSRTVNDFECGQEFFDQFDHRYHFCASITQKSSSQGVCTGDRGGPLVYDGDTLIGVLIDFDEDCDTFGKVERYTKVLRHKKFINTAKSERYSREIRVILIPIAKN